MTDNDIAEMLRSSRTLSAQDVDRIERERTARLGQYSPHGSAPHHCAGESQH